MTGPTAPRGVEADLSIASTLTETCACGARTEAAYIPGDLTYSITGAHKALAAWRRDHQHHAEADDFREGVAKAREVVERVADTPGLNEAARSGVMLSVAAVRSLQSVVGHFDAAAAAPARRPDTQQGDGDG